jgi:outer membrane protein assembly factor BamB
MLWNQSANGDPVIYGEKMVFMTEDFQFTWLDNGKVVGGYKVDSPSDASDARIFDDAINVALSDDMVYISLMPTLVAVDFKTSAPKWRIDSSDDLLKTSWIIDCNAVGSGEKLAFTPCVFGKSVFASDDGNLKVYEILK